MEFVDKDHKVKCSSHHMPSEVPNLQLVTLVLV
jgi:hypothetical protein